MKNRIRSIDVMRGISIILVCLGHVFGTVGNVMNPLWQWFNVFEVGIFFAISGYVEAVKDGHKTGFLNYTYRKALGILLPYITFSIIAVIVRIFYFWLNGGISLNDIYNFIKVTVTGDGLGALWFLPVLFLASLIAYPAMRNRIAAVIEVVLCIAAMYLYAPVNAAMQTACGGTAPVHATSLLIVIFRSFAAAGMITAGYYMFGAGQRLKRAGRAVNVIMTICCFAFSVVAGVLLSIDFRTMEFAGAGWMVFLDVICILFVLIRVCAGADKESLKPSVDGFWNLLAFYGKNSVIILCTHLELFLVNILTIGMGGTFGPITNAGIHYYIRSGIILLLLLMVEYVLIIIVRKYLPFMVKIGRRDCPHQQV